jgi:hypothetical protein
LRTLLFFWPQIADHSVVDWVLANISNRVHLDLISLLPYRYIAEKVAL